MVTDYRNSILHADCLQMLPELPAESVNFVLTDPPYITRYKSRDGRTVPNDDNASWLKHAFTEIHRVLAQESSCVSFYGWPQADRFIRAYRDAGFRIVGHFVFPKRYTSSSKFVRYQHECAHLLAKGNPKHPKYAIGDGIGPVDNGNKHHPTEKPLSVLLPAPARKFLSEGKVGGGEERTYTFLPECVRLGRPLASLRTLGINPRAIIPTFVGTGGAYRASRR